MSGNVDLSKFKKPTTGTTSASTSKAASAPKAEAKNISAFGKLTTSGKSDNSVFSKGDKSTSSTGTTVPKGFGGLTTSKKVSETKSEALKTRIAGQTKDVNSVFGQYSAPNNTTSHDIGNNNDGMMSDKDFKDKGGRGGKGGHDVRGGHDVHGGQGHYADYGDHGGRGGIRHGDEKSTSVFGHGCDDGCGDSFKFHKKSGVIDSYTRYKTGHAGSNFYNQVNHDYHDVMSLNFNDVYNKNCNCGCSTGTGSLEAGILGNQRVVYMNSSNKGNSSYGNYNNRGYSNYGYNNRYSGNCGSSKSNNAFQNAINNIGTLGTYLMGGASLGKALSNMITPQAVTGTAVGQVQTVGGNSGNITLTNTSQNANANNNVTANQNVNSSASSSTPETAKTTDVKGVQTKNDSVINQLNSADENNYKEALAAGDTQYAANEQSINTQNKAVSDANKNIGSIQGEQTTNTQGLQDTKTNLDKCDSMFDNQNDTLTKQEELRKNLTSQKEKYDEGARTANENIEKYKEEAKTQTNEIATQDKVIQTKKPEVAQLEAQYKQAQAADAAANPKTNTAEAIKTKLDTAKQELKAAEEAKAKAEKAKAEAEKNQGKAETEHKKYSDMSTQAQTDIEESQQITEKVTEEQKVTKETQEKLKTQKTKFEEREKTLKTALDSNKTALANAEKNATTLTADRDKLVNEQNKLRERMNATNAEYNKGDTKTTNADGTYKVGSTSYYDKNNIIAGTEFEKNATNNTDSANNTNYIIIGDSPTNYYKLPAFASGNVMVM